MHGPPHRPGSRREYDIHRQVEDQIGLALRQDELRTVHPRFDVRDVLAVQPREE